MNLIPLTSSYCADTIMPEGLHGPDRNPGGPGPAPQRPVCGDPLRVHILTSPLTPYLRYECEWGYAFNEAAGEKIHIVDLSEHPDPRVGVPHDFWLLDDRHVLVMHYDDAGRFLGGEPMPDTSLLAYQRARDRVLAAAEPFGTWWARHAHEWRENHPA